MMKILLALLVLLPATLGHETDLPDLPKPRVVIAGMSGSGKSTLANVLLGEDPLCKNCTFEWCDGLDSCTKETTYAAGKWLGKGGLDFTVVDTPGFGDSDLDDAANVEEMMKILNENVQSSNAIILLFKGDDTRFGAGLVNMVREMTMLFGEKMWDYAVIGVSFWAYDQNSIDERNKYCPDLCHDEEWFVKEMNLQLQNKTNMKRNLSAVFIDSFSQYNDNVNDETQQFYFQQETAKLFDFMNTKGDFLFRTISDVLLENEEMTKEIKWLNDIIKDNITELQTNMIEIEEDLEDIRISSLNNKNLIAADEENIQINTNNIQDNSNSIGAISNSVDANSDNINGNMVNIEKAFDKTASNAELLMALSTQLNDLTTEFNTRISTLEGEVSGMNQAPVGSIIAWVTSVPGGESNPVPTGWQECNGNTIAEGIWKGKKTPNLNEDGYFLRGGPQSENNLFQNSMVEDLQYYDLFQGLQKKNVDQCHGLGYYVGPSSSHGGTGTEDDPMCGRTLSIKVGNEDKVGDETRPKNMKVTYIIKTK